VSDRRDRARWWVGILGIAAAVVGVIGLFVAPQHLYVWVFLIAFGVAPLPDQAYKKWRARHSSH